MPYPENNEKNRRELASKYVSTWSVEELRDYVAGEYSDNFKHDEGEFKAIWDDFEESFEWSEELREGIKKECPNPGCHCGACGGKKKDTTNIPKWQVEDATNGRR
mgnify:CR=1 FL=1